MKRWKTPANKMLQLLVLVWVITQTACVLMLWIGSSIKENRILRWVGEMAHQRKLAALDRYWPLTLIRPAVERKDSATCIGIFSLLIWLKSLGCLFLGLFVVFWLPLASLLIPSIVAIHQPDNAQLAASIRKVALLQVTSHSLAAAIGFVISISLWNGNSMTDTVASLRVPLIVGIAGSVGFAIAAGKSETEMLLKHGL